MTYDAFRGVVVYGPTIENYSHWAFWDWDSELQIISTADSPILIWPPDANAVLEAADTLSGPWKRVSNPPNPFSVGSLGPAKFFRLRPL
jgi:hypothetical protein